MAQSEILSESSKFYIYFGDKPELDFGGKTKPNGQGFATFSKVRKEMRVVKKIQRQKDNDQYLIKPKHIIKVPRK